MFQPRWRTLAALALVFACAGAVRAERKDEAAAVALLEAHKPLSLPEDSKTPEQAVTRIMFWVGRDGNVEAVEMECGERALFDEIVNPLLDWKFKGKNFTTVIGFQRRGRRAWLVEELPRSRRPRQAGCPAGGE